MSAIARGEHAPAPRLNMLLPKAASEFNKMYRERRLAAQGAGRPFPYLPQARAQLSQAMEIARATGWAAPNEFWDFVFRPPQPTEAKLRRHWGKAAEVREAELRERRRHADRLHELRKAAPRPKPSDCEVCGSFGTIVLDHCHLTGKFRGWLCANCNFALGLARDSPETLRKLADYLCDSMQT